MRAREIIAGAIVGNTAGTGSRMALEALTAAGYRIVSPDTLDPVTLEAAAKVAESFIVEISGSAMGAAIRALQHKEPS